MGNFVSCFIGIVAAALVGCDNLGPMDIRNARPNYNDAIHDTTVIRISTT